jgi:hypothetical protein
MSSPRAIAVHDSHFKHGSVVGPSDFWQFNAFARIRAIDVFPVPRVPVNRYACAIRFDSIARFNVFAT